MLRARRIAAHSLAADRDALRALMNVTVTGHMALDGTVRTRRQLPDEEAFESLAARVRPLLLPGEPIYYGKVLAALGRLVLGAGTSQGEPVAWVERVDRLRDAWDRVDLDGRDVLAFSVQRAHRDGSSATSSASDVQLAAAWLYADLVHADARGAKEDGLAFPVRERYAAAVNVFSRVALLTLMTLDAVVQMKSAGLIHLEESAFVEAVVVAADELREDGVAYFAPPDAPVPDIRQDLSSAPGGWQRLTPTELLRMDRSNQVEVTLGTAEGAVVARYDAAVSNRWLQGGELHWEMLLAGVCTIEFAFRVEEEALVACRLVSMESHATTNRLMLSDAQLQLEMSRSAWTKIAIHGEPFFELGHDPVGPEETAAVEVAVDTLGDLVALEELAGEPLAPLSGSYSGGDRVRLRQARLLMEGNVVPIGMGPLVVTAAHGTVPQVIMTPGGPWVIGDQTRVPLPAKAIRHPRMEVVNVSVTPDGDSSVDVVTLSVPAAEPFLAWVPSLVQVDTDDALLTPVRLQLSHLDEAAVFGSWQGHISAARPHEGASG